MTAQQHIIDNPHYRPILDHGFVGFPSNTVTVTTANGTEVEGVMPAVFGSDASIVQAARVSYGKGTKSVQEDRGLIRYLMRHKHSTPFEM